MGARVAASHDNRAQLQAEVKLLEQKIEQLADRIVNTGSPAVVNAFETRLASLETQKAKAAEMVTNCGRPITDFDSANRTALEFLENTIKTWTCGTLEAKRWVIRVAFASRLSYQRGHGFRTAETAIPFRIFNDLEGLEPEDSEMVPEEGP